MIHVVALEPCVHFVQREKNGLLARLLVDEIAFFHIRPHQFVAPPGQPFVLRLQVAVVVTSIVEVFQRKQLFLLSSHRQAG